MLGHLKDSHAILPRSSKQLEREDPLAELPASRAESSREANVLSQKPTLEWAFHGCSCPGVSHASVK